MRGAAGARVWLASLRCWEERVLLENNESFQQLLLCLKGVRCPPFRGRRWADLFRGALCPGTARRACGHLRIAALGACDRRERAFFSCVQSLKDAPAHTPDQHESNRRHFGSLLFVHSSERERRVHRSWVAFTVKPQGDVVSGASELSVFPRGPLRSAQQRRPRSGRGCGLHPR